MGHLQDPAFALDKRRKRDALPAAFAAYREAAEEYAQRRNPELKPQVEASRPLEVGGVGAGLSAWVADEST